MNQVFSTRSTNGRWGLAIVSPADGVKLPAEGTITHLGRAAGIDTYLFTPCQTGTWVHVVKSDVTAHGGATVVAHVGLQSNSDVTVLLLGPQAVIETHGYKGRGSWMTAFVSGVEVEIPAPVLLAMGLIQAGGEVLPVPPPPELPTAMAAAFAKLKVDA